ncbi:uncharacterized protein [Eurosta solidaginis]|uniref:uncharacterized protein n=1 Tax=Eurosta solidaginis TaxID=178769 RepID=UPI0035307946
MLNHQFAIAPLSILIFFTSSCLVAGQVERSGSCRNDISLVSSVDSSTFQGIWHMHSRYTFNPDKGYRCQKTQYTAISDNLYEVKDFKISNANNCVKVKAATIKSLPDGRIQVRGDEPGAQAVYYNILTYCNDYFIGYICQNLAGSKYKEFLWINTRHPTPPDNVKNAYIKDLEDQGISTSEIEWMNHRDCNY